MLGTFSNGTGVNANVYGYTLAGKTGTAEAEFNADVSSDQWVIGYTPDVVISQWVGFDKTDENHYLSDSSAGTASYIFSTQASYILPYTDGNTFSVENAYTANGIALDYGGSEEVTNTESKSILDSLRESAQSASQQVTDAVENANIGQKAQELWDNVVNYFR